MENGRQLKIQSELERKRKRERDRDGARKESRVGTERARCGMREHYAGKWEKDRKRQTVGRILQRSARPFRTHPIAENNGRRMRLLFHF